MEIARMGSQQVAVDPLPSRSSSGRSEPQPHTQGEARSRTTGAHKSILLKRRVLSIEAFAREMRNGDVATQELITTYGSQSAVPIPVPLEPGEHVCRYDSRFLGWIRNRGHSTDKLHDDPELERSLRWSFARFKTSTYCTTGNRSEDQSAKDKNKNDRKRTRSEHGGDSDAKDSGRRKPDERPATPVAKKPRQEHNGPSKPTATHALLRQRVLSIDEYVREVARDMGKKLTAQDRIARYGTPIAPIPVPLFAGETIDEYERKFRGGTTKSAATLAKEPNTERVLRMHFAACRLNEARQWQAKLQVVAAPQPLAVETGDCDEGTAIRSATTESTVESERTPSQTDTLPVVMPSSRPPQSQPEPQPEPQTKEEPPPQHQRQEQLQFPTTCSMGCPPTGAPPEVFFEMLLACGCFKCILECSRGLIAQVTELKQASASPIHKPESTNTITPSCFFSVSSTSSSPTSSDVTEVDVAKMVHITSLLRARRQRHHRQGHTTGERVAIVDDPIELQLQVQYDELNDRVITNQQALDQATAQLQHTPLDRVRVAAPNLRDSQELRVLIQDEMDLRNAALAMLVVYMWRATPRELEQRIQADGVGNIVHVQRSCHQRCATLARELAARHKEIEELKARLDTVLCEAPPEVFNVESDAMRLTRLQTLGAKLTGVEREVQRLIASRRRELTTLLHFDVHVRELVTALLQET